MMKYGFTVVDSIGEYELLSLSFDGTSPNFSNTAKKMTIEKKELTIYYGLQCSYISNCLEQVEIYCKDNSIPLNIIPIDTLEKAKGVPCVFNNWAVFYDGNFETVHLLNEGFLKKMLAK